jgi:hypothetical protein
MSQDRYLGGRDFPTMFRATEKRTWAAENKTKKLMLDLASKDG